MNATAARILRFGGALLVLVTTGWVLTGLAAKPEHPEISLATDWSHRHLIFSQPSTAEAYRRVADDPRYWQQQYRRMPRYLAAQRDSDIPESLLNRWFRWRRRKLHRDWSEDLGMGASMGPTNFPAKFSLNINQATCASDPGPDFVIFPTGLASSSTQASLVAYNNLYGGCSGPKPEVYWAYDTGGQILTSPTYSLDGTQVAFVQTSGGVGTLVLLKWAPSATESVTSPMTLSAVANGEYRACSAPCMTTLNLQNGSGGTTDDTSSSAFYDYTNDIAWIGGGGGYLHKFSGLFNGTPAEVLTGGFPALVNSGATLANPVYDRVSLSVFVEDTDGFLYSVDAASASVTQSGQLDFGGAIGDGPMVDSTAGLVYVFASSDGTGGCFGGADCAAVYQLSTSLVAGDSGSEVAVGSSTVSGSGTPNPLYSGDFDSTYLASPNRTGNLYVCGNTGGPPILYQVPISAGTMGTALPGPPLSNSTTPCSPITDIRNPNATGGATEWIFMGTRLNGTSAGCAHAGCLFNFKVTPWLASTTYSQSTEILDSNLNIEAATTSGQSGSTKPSWAGSVGASTSDGTVQWVNQGTLGSSVFASNIWQSGKRYNKGNEILDARNNVEYCVSTGISGGAVPTFSPNAGGITNDSSVRWRNLGALPTAALPASGGTTGIIMDNIVSTGTLAGASQVYFSTLSNQTCATSGGTGGCAVQASQPGLK